MIKFSAYYPHGDSSTFDFDYYCGTHMSTVRQRCGSALKRVDVEKGIAGAGPGEPPPFVAVGHLYFDSLDDFQSSFMPHLPEFIGDLPNFTNIQPQAQVSEVAL